MSIAITRREFLKVASANLAALAIPLRAPLDPTGSGWSRLTWPTLELGDLPSRVASILEKAPRTQVGPDGYMVVEGGVAGGAQPLPLAPTEWNRQNNHAYDRLYSHVPWGIVLHWYGERENFDCSLKSYLRGFDSLRQVDDYITRTSAHFLVADGLPAAQADEKGEARGIIQTQVPYPDGTPLVASHLQALDFLAHRQKKQYFVRALYQLGYREPGVHSLLQDLFDGVQVDPNQRTIAVEIAGYDFDGPSHAPSEQKIANVLSVVWALMRRYNIPASGVLGHHEIQLGKADPGKKFMNTIRYLIGVKALVEGDPRMQRLVFGQYLQPGASPQSAVGSYFQNVHDFLMMVGNRRCVYEWESDSKYWFVQDAMQGRVISGLLATEFLPPLAGGFSLQGKRFLDPRYHEGVDLYQGSGDCKRPNQSEQPTRLLAAGECLFAGEVRGVCQGKTAMFRHRQTDGAQVISVFSHLQRFGDLQVGRIYPAGYPLGALHGDSGHCSPYLHMAIAYGATWEMDLKQDPSRPLNAGTSWVSERYINPLEYLQKRIGSSGISERWE